MLFLHQYIDRFKNEDSQPRVELSSILEETRKKYDIFEGGNPLHAFEAFVERYNWLGSHENKQKYDINQNLARNLPGALMQDFLLHLAMKICESYPSLDVFTEVRISFGRYPLWEKGEVVDKAPSERSDLAVGYLLEKGEYIKNIQWPKQPFYKLSPGQTVEPLITINSKIRVSQSEFFDWLGREQLARYIIRSPLSLCRLELCSNGTIIYHANNNKVHPGFKANFRIFAPTTFSPANRYSVRP